MNIVAKDSSARNPDTLFLLGLLIVSGLTQLIAGAEPGTIESQVPGWMLIGWSVVLFAGAVTTVTGLFLKSRINGLLTEGAGRVTLAPACLAYAGAILNSVGMEGAIVAGLLTGLAMASLYRVKQIRDDIRGLRQDLHTLIERQEGRSL